MPAGHNFDRTKAQKSGLCQIQSLELLIGQRKGQASQIVIHLLDRT